MKTEDLIAELRVHYPCGTPAELGLSTRPAVLVVDFIEGFTSHESPLGGPWDSEVAATRTLIGYARAGRVPVIFTTADFAPKDFASNVLHAKTPRVGILLAGSPWVEIDHRLEVQPQDRIVRKKHGSAFFGTDLDVQLRDLGVDSLLIAGCVTSGCVRASAVDAAQHGFRPAVVREAVGDRSPLANEANLIDIEQRYGDILSLEQARAYLGGLRRDTELHPAQS